MVGIWYHKISVILINCRKYQPENPNDFDINKSTKISGKVDGYNSGIFIQNSNADTKDSNGGDWLGGSGVPFMLLMD